MESTLRAISHNFYYVKNADAYGKAYGRPSGFRASMEPEQRSPPSGFNPGRKSMKLSQALNMAIEALEAQVWELERLEKRLPIHKTLAQAESIKSLKIKRAAVETLKHCAPICKGQAATRLLRKP